MNSTRRNPVRKPKLPLACLHGRTPVIAEGSCEFSTVVGSDAVALIATLLRGEDDRWPIFLLGAGASFRSGVPTAADAVKQIAKIFYAERKLQGARPPERVRPSEWEPWLREQPWLNKAAVSLGENFPATVEHLLVPAELRKRVLLEIMNPAMVSQMGTRS